MNIKRYLLYSSYLFGKKIRYIRLMNAFSNYAKILTFHRVNDYDSNFLTTSRETFEKTISTISQDYKVISLQSLVEKIKNKERLGHKTVIVTFDDGYRDNFLYAAPILRKYDVPATFFVTSGYINTNRVFPWDKQSDKAHALMTWDEVRELSHMGFDIGAHTVNHTCLGQLPLEIARIEVTRSKEQIEEQINMRITAFSYPVGVPACLRDDVKEVIREAGFDCSCSVYGGKVTEHSDLYDLRRISMYPNTIELLMELDNFMTYFDGKMKINIWLLQVLTSVVLGRRSTCSPDLS